MLANKLDMFCDNRMVWTLRFKYGSFDVHCKIWMCEFEWKWKSPQFCHLLNLYLPQLTFISGWSKHHKLSKYSILPLEKTVDLSLQFANLPLIINTTAKRCQIKNESGFPISISSAIKRHSIRTACLKAHNPHQVDSNQHLVLEKAVNKALQTIVKVRCTALQ